MSETPFKKQALLIGINQYQILPELKYARQDAEAVEQALKQNYCFTDDEVMLLTDAKSGFFMPTNRLIILSHLEKLANQNLDLLIFGFWGHGVVRNGLRYLCPLDVMPEAVEQLGVSFDELMNRLTKIRAKNTCLLLDCCQKVHDRGESEVLTADDQTVIENAARDIVSRRKEIEPEFQSNVAVLNSCKEGQAAYEWDNRKHGIFTAHLLDAFNRRYDSVSQIVGYVSHNVEKTALELGKTQTPLCRLEGDIPLPVNSKSAPLISGSVFISYRHCNADLVAPVEQELKRRGISYFIDRVGVNYGMEYSEALTQAIADCNLLLLFWTPEVKGSEDIINEVVLAQKLKKTVIPYKIGNFSEVEHRRLCYHIARLSHYEVPKQTPESVVELVNRVEQALTGKVSAPQYSFVLPENSQDAVIQKPVVDDIHVTYTPERLEQPKQLIQYNEIELPPLPEEALNLQAENKSLEKAIEQLDSFTHESLAQANDAVAQAQAQLDAWEKRREERWKDLPQATREYWEEAIINNPECTETDIAIQQGDLSNQEYFDLLEKFQSGKKYQQAKLELERVEWERKNKCDNVIAQFRQKIEDNNRVYDDHINSFFDEVLMTILGVMPGYDDVNAPFPDNDVIAPLRQLDKYKLGWKASDEIARARVFWKQKRPCVTQNRVIAPTQISISEKRPVAKITPKVKSQSKNTGVEGTLGISLIIFGVILLIFGGLLVLQIAQTKYPQTAVAIPDRVENSMIVSESPIYPYGEEAEPVAEPVAVAVDEPVAVAVDEPKQSFIYQISPFPEYINILLSGISFISGILSLYSGIVLYREGYEHKRFSKKMLLCFLYLVIFSLFAMGVRCVYCGFSHIYGDGGLYFYLFNHAIILPSRIFHFCGSLILFFLGYFSIQVAKALLDDVALSTHAKIVQFLVTPIFLIMVGYLMAETHRHYRGEEVPFTTFFLCVGICSCYIGALHALYYIKLLYNYIKS